MKPFGPVQAVEAALVTVTSIAPLLRPQVVSVSLTSTAVGFAAMGATSTPRKMKFAPAEASSVYVVGVGPASVILIRLLFEVSVVVANSVAVCVALSQRPVIPRSPVPVVPSAPAVPTSFVYVCVHVPPERSQRCRPPPAELRSSAIHARSTLPLLSVSTRKKP